MMQLSEVEFVVRVYLGLVERISGSSRNTVFVVFSIKLNLRIDI